MRLPAVSFLNVSFRHFRILLLAERSTQVCFETEVRVHGVCVCVCVSVCVCVCVCERETHREGEREREREREERDV